MALEWGQPDGWCYNQEYVDQHEKGRYTNWLLGETDHFDLDIDGLRVSKSTEFS